MSATAKISLGVALVDAQGNKIALLSAQAAILMTTFADEIIILPPNSYFVNVPFPSGMTRAAFAWIQPFDAPDLKCCHVYDGQGAITVPPGKATVLYDLAGLWLSSVAGGSVQVVVGA